MLSVLIVDDEFLQRQMVKNSIDWNSIGLNIVNEAEDGLQAIEMTQLYLPDIVIMDINIPFIDGINVSKRIKLISPKTEILILSAYGEFVYAKEALGFGASCFILKPLDPGELYRELLHSKDKIIRKETWNNKLKDLKKENDQKEKGNFLLERLAGFPIISKDIRELEKKYNISFEDKLCLLDIKICQDDCFFENESIIIKIIEEWFKHFEFINIGKDLIIIIFSNYKDNSDCNGSFLLKINLLIEKLNQEVCSRTLCFGGISSIHQGVSQLHLSYVEARNALLHAKQKKQIIQIYEPNRLLTLLENIDYNPVQILHNLRTKQYHLVIEQMHDCFLSIRNQGMIINIGYHIAMSYLIVFTVFFSEAGIEIPNSIANIEKSFYQRIDDDQFIIMENELIMILNNTISVLEERAISSTKRKAEAARIYIDNNYSRYDLSLDLIADDIGVNPSYLSSIFKNIIGITISRYIMELRMKIAFEQLSQNHSMTIKSVSDMVGYNDEYYFSKSFKGYFGISPSKLLENQFDQKN